MEIILMDLIEETKNTERLKPHEKARLMAAIDQAIRCLAPEVVNVAAEPTAPAEQATE